MSAAGRVRLGTAHSAAHRRRVYRTAEALEVDEIGTFELSRRRVFFAEISWVTLHRARPGAMVWALAALAGLALLGVLFLGLDGSPISLYVLLGVAAVGGLGSAFAATPVWVVTAYGRRTRAEIRFRLREVRARTVYGEICRLTGAAQAMVPPGGRRVERNGL
jgi:hypothetical protein